MNYYTEQDIIDGLRQQITNGKQQSQLAGELKMHTSTLSAILNGHRNIGPVTLRKLGYNSTRFYRKLGGKE